MTKFKISGSFDKRGFKQIFSKKFPAENKERALEKMYSIIGSNHKVKRREIKEIKVEKINDKEK